MSLNVISFLAMNQGIVDALRAEIARLQSALSILEGTPAVKRRGRPPGLKNAPAWVTSNKLLPAAETPTEKPARKKRSFIAQQRKEQADRARAMWAARKKAAKKAAKS